MLSDMRKRVRIIMFIVAAAFIAGFLMTELWRTLAGRGSRGRARDTSGYVGRVGKHNVTPEEHRSAVSYMTDKYKSDNRLRDLSNEDYHIVEQRAWQYIVAELTWAKVLKAARIRVTEAEVMEIVKSNPPAELRDRPELMTDGKFDPEKYVQVINAPENREYFSKYVRELVEKLPKEKFRIDVFSSYRVTNGETEDALSAFNSKWRTTALLFGPKVISEKEPPEEEVRAWYNAHKEDFRTKETRQLRYVFFPLAVTREDSATAKETIDRAYDQLLKGEAFGLTMLDFSDIEGETLAAMVPRTQLDKLTDSVVSRLKPGQHSSAFLVGSQGWQIVALDSARKDSVSLRRIVVRVKMGAEVLATARDSVRSFIEATGAEKFDSVAARFGLTVRSARPLVGDQKELPGLNVENPEQLIEWTRAAKPGQVLDRPLYGYQGYCVFQLAGVEPAGIQDFDKAKKSATWRLRQAKHQEAWLAKARQALDAVRAGMALEQYAQENPGVELQTDSFKGLLDCRSKKGAEFAGTLAALNSGETYGVVETNWGAFIIRCDERTSTGVYEAQNYMGQRPQQVAQAVLQKMLEEPNVKDYRDALAY